MSDVLRAKCLDTPICVIRDLAHAVGLDLQKFTTKNIERIAQDYEMDLREQWNVPKKEGREWFYPSYRYRTQVGKLELPQQINWFQRSTHSIKETHLHLPSNTATTF